MSEPTVVTSAVEALSSGEVIALPTETVYGLAADVSNDAAIRRLFEIKGRPHAVPLPVALAHPDWLDRVAVTQDHRVQPLTSRWWPGPLTLVCSARADLNPIITAGLGTVAMRIPAVDVTRAVIERFGRPVALTSANVHGEAPAMNASEVMSTFADSIAVVVSAAQAPLGIPSTIISLTDPSSITVLREGAVSEREVLDCLRHFEGLQA